MHARAQHVLSAVLLCSVGCGTEPVVAKSTELLAGSTQTGELGAPLAEPLSIRVVGSNGKPFRGAQVSWAVVEGGGALSPATTATDADGIARTTWTLGARLDVSHVATATAAGLSPVTFTATPLLPASATIDKAAGDVQQQVVANPLADLLAATVRLANGRAVQGVMVSWAAGPNAGSVSPASSITNSSGVATTRWSLGTLAGAVTATASVTGLPSTTFSATATPGPVDTVTIAAQTKVVVGSTAQLTARVVDRYGNVITRKTPTWTSNSAQVASVSAPGVVTGVRVGRTTIMATVDNRSGAGLVGVLASPGFGTPTINGVLESGEWTTAAQFAIDVVLPEGGTTPGTVYVMNDASNLYLALRYVRTVNDQGKSVAFEFDNNGSGLFGLSTIEEGDDIIVLNPDAGFFDDYRTYRPPCAAQGACGPLDTKDGGTADGSGVFTHDGAFHVYELAHPLRSGDTGHDFSLSAGQDVGMHVYISIIANAAAWPQGFGETSWPNDGFVYLRVASAP